MPRKTGSSKKQRLVLKPNKNQRKDDLEAFVAEADQVKALTQQAGWGILVRDLSNLKEGLADRLAYTSPNRVEHEEARTQYIAIDKLFSIIMDYEHNREEAIKFLAKLENPDIAVPLDVDNEIPNGRGDSSDGL